METIKTVVATVMLAVLSLLACVSNSSQAETLIVSTLAGGGQGGFADGLGSAARFQGPVAITIDAEGNLYVADSYNAASAR